MQEYKTFEEYSLNSKCKICNKGLFSSDHTNVGNDKVIYTCSYNGERYIFTIYVKSSRITINKPDLSNVHTTIGTRQVVSINPLMFICYCKSNFIENIARSEYSSVYGIEYDEKSLFITKVCLMSENYFYKGSESDNCNYEAFINHKFEKFEIKEHPKKLLVKNPKKYEIKYNAINQDKLKDKDYVLKKVETIKVLR